MSTKKSGILLDGERPRHKEGVRLDRAWEEDSEARKQIDRTGIAKTSVTLAAQTKAPADGEAVAGPATPTDEQMAMIEPFLRSPKKPEELQVFPTLSLNNLEDRDEDRFTDDCVSDFAALDAPHSFIGKSFMLDHQYAAFNTVGRIFNERVVGGEEGDGIKWLGHDVYVPNTPQFQPFLERVDFGLSWAVSVGVMLGKSACSVCGAGFSSWGYWCANGHDKGYWYLEDAETDNWGYPLPCDSNTPGAIKCIREFSEPKDGYELSQVYLGAQYWAGFGKAAQASVQKAARTAEIPKEFGGMEIPILRLKREEAEALPFRHEPAKVTEARQKFGVETQEDGSVRWTDDDKIVWTFDPFDEDPEVLSLGRMETFAETPTKDNEGDDDGEHGIPGGSRSEGVGEEGRPEVVLEDADPEADQGGSGSDADGGGASEVEDEPEEEDDDSSGDSDADDDASDEDDEGEDKTAAQLRAAHDRTKRLIDLAGADGAGETAAALALSLGVLSEDVVAALPDEREDGDTLSDEERDLLAIVNDANDALAAELDADEPEDEPEEVEDSGSEGDETKSARFNVKTVQKTALRAGVPAVIVGKWATEENPTIDSLLALVGSEMKTLSGVSVSKELKRKASLGDAYVKELRAQALSAFVLANRDPKLPEKGVNTEAFEKVLDRVGDDVDTLKTLIEQHRETAQRNFPGAVRRSTSPVDPESSAEISDLPQDRTVSYEGGANSAANRLHS